jgi:hypothetical protein
MLRFQFTLRTLLILVAAIAFGPAAFELVPP